MWPALGDAVGCIQQVINPKMQLHKPQGSPVTLWLLPARGCHFIEQGLGVQQANLNHLVSSSSQQL